MCVRSCHRVQVTAIPIGRNARSKVYTRRVKHGYTESSVPIAAPLAETDDRVDTKTKDELIEFVKVSTGTVTGGCMCRASYAKATVVAQLLLLLCKCYVVLLARILPHAHTCTHMHIPPPMHTHSHACTCTHAHSCTRTRTYTHCVSASLVSLNAIASYFPSITLCGVCFPAIPLCKYRHHCTT